VKITDVRVSSCFALVRNWIFVEVITDSGYGGVGEATIENREKTILGHLQDLTDYLIGRDPLEIEAVIRGLTRDSFWAGGYVAMTGLAAIEMALWDILGQKLGVPVWQLFGGRLRRRVRAYANGWQENARSLEDWARLAGEVVEDGYSALKFDPFGTAGPLIEREQLEEAVSIVSAVSKAAGPKTDLLIEAHGRFNLQAAETVSRALARFNCFWIEEPIPPGNPAALAGLRSKTSVPLATGERAHSRLDFREILALQAASIIQPDVIHAGGLAETRKIAAMAETWSVGVAPHNPNGPIATAATLAVDAVIPNFVIQETLGTSDPPWRHEVVDGCPRVIDGYLELSEAPGLGVRIVPEEVARHPMRKIEVRLWEDEWVRVGEETPVDRSEPPNPS
jgi:galactonate dehydratase